MPRECDPCVGDFPEPRDAYAWDRDGGDDVPGVTRRYPTRPGVDYVPEPEPIGLPGAPGEHAERHGAG